MNQQSLTDLNIRVLKEVTYERKDRLFGLVKWWVKVKSDTVQRDLVIESTEEFMNVYFNGIRIK